MKEISGDIFKMMETGNFDGFCVTTNGEIKKDGKAVMGAGVAKAVRDKFPGIDSRLGFLLKNHGHYVAHLGEFEHGKIMTFPTKFNWRSKSEIDLIVKSARELEALIEKHNYSSILLPKPGCSNGGLEWEYVKSKVENILSDRVIIISN